MAQPSAPHLRSLYRRILRELPSRPATSPSPLQRRLRSQFESSPSSPLETTNPSLDAIEQITQYLQAQRTYTTLVERYNPGMNMTEEERVRLSARRIGMELPKGLEEVLGRVQGGDGGKDDEGKS